MVAREKPVTPEEADKKQSQNAEIWPKLEGIHEFLQSLENVGVLIYHKFLTLEC